MPVRPIAPPRPPARRGLARLAAALLVAAALAVLAGCSGGEAPAAATLPDEPPAGLDFDPSGWRTDFARHSVPLEEFHSGGPPRDGIPPIDAPRTVAPDEEPIPGREPVIALEVGGEARAYPLRIMIWHEIVNDVVGGVPVAVTFCPLCNTAVVFDRRLRGRTLDFGTTGNLRLSDLVMWDRQTESWWQQFSGEAVVGELTGARLRRVPARIMSAAAFADEHPGGRVLSSETGHDRAYGDNPYAGYDDVDTPPFLLRDRDLDDRLPPKARVVVVEGPRSTLVLPLSVVAERGVVEETLDGRPIAVVAGPAAASALDAEGIADGRDVETVLVLDRRAGGRELELRREGDRVLTADGAEVDGRGRILTGPLAGERLRPLAHDVPFWFAVAAFLPDVEISDGE